jgi:hypothetical protein
MRCPAAAEPGFPASGDHHDFKRILPMKNEQANVPTTLTAEQTELVSGGAFSAVSLVRAGCPTCTSGLPTAFQNIAAVINPAPMMQTFG